MKLLKILILFVSFASFGQDTLQVAIKVDPPFVMKYKNGHYGGVCIDLLNGMGVPYTTSEVTGTYEEILNALDNGNLQSDIFANPVTITKDRIERVDFSQPFYVTSTGIAYTDKAKPKFNWMAIIKPIGNLILIIFILGVIFWYIERKHNESVDDGLIGILTGFYWVSATMTTVGYGDVAPKTKTGVLMATKLMWVSMLLTAYMIAQIDVATEKVELQLGDLTKCKVATIKGSYTAKFLDENDIKYVQYDTPTQAFDAMNEGDLDAFVYDTPVLQFLTGKDIYSGIKIADETFEQQTFGFAGKESFKKLNPKLLNVLSSDEWEETLNKYNLE